METYSVSLALYEGSTQVAGGFISQSPVTRSFDVFLVVSEQTVEQTIEAPVIRNAIALIITPL